MRIVHRLLSAAAIVAALSAPSTVALAAGGGAQKVPIEANTGGSCSTGALAGVPTDSFVVINFPADRTVTAEVALKHFTPNTTLDVLLVQTPSGADCLTVDATVTTNAQGNGNVHVSEPLLPGTTGAFVYVTPTSGFSAGITHVVPLS